jgi:hypothetical protein
MEFTNLAVMRCFEQRECATKSRIKNTRTNKNQNNKISNYEKSKKAVDTSNICGEIFRKINEFLMIFFTIWHE